MEKTIAAISTAAGNGGIGIVRLSGNKSFEIINKIFIPKNKNREIKGYSLKYGNIYEEKLNMNNKNNENSEYIVVKIPREEIGKSVFDAEEYIENTTKSNNPNEITEEIIEEIKFRARESKELIHYGEIEGNKIRKVPKELMEDFAKLQEQGDNEEIISEINKLYKTKSYDIKSLEKIFEGHKPDIESCDEIGKFLKEKESQTKEELEKGEK